jgi:hypothetical protein
VQFIESPPSSEKMFVLRCLGAVCLIASFYLADRGLFDC